MILSLQSRIRSKAKQRSLAGAIMVTFHNLADSSSSGHTIDLILHSNRPQGQIPKENSTHPCPIAEPGAQRTFIYTVRFWQSHRPLTPCQLTTDSQEASLTPIDTKTLQTSQSTETQLWPTAKYALPPCWPTASQQASALCQLESQFCHQLGLRPSILLNLPCKVSPPPLKSLRPQQTRGCWMKLATFDLATPSE